MTIHSLRSLRLSLPELHDKGDKMNYSIVLHKKNENVVLFDLPEKDKSAEYDGIKVSLSVKNKNGVNVYEVKAESDVPNECYISLYGKGEGRYFSFTGEAEKEDIYRQSPHNPGKYVFKMQGSAVPMIAVIGENGTDLLISDNPAHCQNYTTQHIIPEKNEVFLSSGDKGGSPNFEGEEFNEFYHPIDKDKPHFFRFIFLKTDAADLKQIRREAFVAIEKVWGKNTGSIYAAQCFSSNYMHYRWNENRVSDYHIVPGLEYSNTQYHRDSFWQTLILPVEMELQAYKAQTMGSLAAAERPLFYIIWSYRIAKRGGEPNKESLEFALEKVKNGLDYVGDGRYCPKAGCPDGSFRNWFDICCFEPDDVDAYSHGLCVCALKCAVELGYTQFEPYYEKAKAYFSKLFNGEFVQLSLFKPYLCLDYAVGDILHYYLFGTTFIDDEIVEKTYSKIMNGKARTPYGTKIVALPDGEFLPLEGFMAGDRIHPEMKMHPYGEYANGGSYHIYEMLFHMDACAHKVENSLENMIWRLKVDFEFDGTTHEYMNTVTGTGHKPNQGWNAAIYAMWEEMTHDGRTDKKFLDAAEEMLRTM